MKDCMFWKKDDVGITRAGPLSERQKANAEKTLSTATELITVGTTRKSGKSSGKSSRN
jgi:hypothetical protein